MQNLWRHGDLLIQKVDNINNSLPKKQDTILLEGEASNHFHRLSGGTIYADNPNSENNWNIGFFELEEEAELTHEEHETIRFMPGKYKFWSQREYDPQAERRVID